MTRHLATTYVPVQVALMLIYGIAGCSGMGLGGKVTDILADRAGYLRIHFSEQHIPFEVNPYLPPERRVLSGKRFVVTYAARIAAKEVEVTCSTAYLRQGVVNTECESVHGEFYKRLYFEISYLGLLRLRSEQVFSHSEYARPIQYLYEIDKFPSELIDAKPSVTYQFQGVYGGERGVNSAFAPDEWGLGRMEYWIKTKPAVPAAQLAVGLLGDAIQVELETRNVNGLLATRDTRFYLPAYGVSLLAKFETAAGTDVFTAKRIAFR